MNYNKIYSDIFNLHKKHAGAKTEKDLENFHHDLMILSKNYQDSKFVNEMINAVVNEIDRIYKQKIKNKGD